MLHLQPIQGTKRGLSWWRKRSAMLRCKLERFASAAHHAMLELISNQLDFNRDGFAG